jgi:hypothetical protein
VLSAGLGCVVAGAGAADAGAADAGAGLSEDRLSCGEIDRAGGVGRDDDAEWLEVGEFGSGLRVANADAGRVVEVLLAVRTA